MVYSPDLIRPTRATRLCLGDTGPASMLVFIRFILFAQIFVTRGRHRSKDWRGFYSSRLNLCLTDIIRFWAAICCACNRTFM
jgi:hypothetical protein